MLSSLTALGSYVVIGLLVAAAAATLVVRPRLLLLPVIWAFAIRGWIAILLSYPAVVREWILAETLAKNAAALESHANVAAAMWTANNTAFRKVSREMFSRVAAGYGLGPHGEDDDAGDEESAPLRTIGGQDAFDAAKVAGAADAITRAGGKPPELANKKEAAKA